MEIVIDRIKNKKYPSYKESGVEWSGLIPQHWNTKPIRAIFQERREKNLGPVTDFILSVTKDRGVIPYDEKGAIGNNKSEDIQRYKVVYPNDLVINKMNVIIGSLGLSRYHGALSQVYIVLQPKSKEININYYAYLVSDESFYKSMIKYCTGIMELRESLNLDEFKKLHLPIPPIEEQTIIAQFLDRKTALIDKAITIKEKQIELLKERRQILIHKAITRGLNPDVKMKDSDVEWIGEIPEHWDVKRLKYISAIQSGVTLGKTYVSKNLKSYPYLRVANVQSDYFKLDEIAYLQLPPREAEKYFVKKGDILVTEGGDLDKLGRGTVWNGEIENCLHQNHVFAVRVIQLFVSSEYASNLMESDYGRKYFTHTANKTTNLASTNSTKLGNFPLILPPKDERTVILNYILHIKSKVQNIISNKEKEIEKLKEYKSSLINSAVTGKIKVC